MAEFKSQSKAQKSMEPKEKNTTGSGTAGTSSSSGGMGTSGGAAPPAGSGTSAAGTESAAENTAESGGLPGMDAGKAAETTQRFVDQATLDDVSLDRIDHVDVETERELLQQQLEAQREQMEQQVDHGVQQGVTDLERNLEDAKEQFQTQRDQAAADEMRALDNQALYAEARGDRGGLGQAQYASIQNTAAVNRRTVNQQQTKLSTDTARQIADLRAQGEFQKADKLLELTQNYLSQLMDLERWAKEMNMSVDQFNSQIEQWEAQYRLSMREFLTNTELSAAQMTGAFADGTLTFEAQTKLREELAAAGQAMLKLGLTPTDQQLEAMGWTKEQYNAYKSMLAAAAAAASSGGGGGGGGRKSSSGSSSASSGSSHTAKSLDNIGAGSSGSAYSKSGPR